jgi:hypothetical protein
MPSEKPEVKYVIVLLNKSDSIFNKTITKIH